MQIQFKVVYLKQIHLTITLYFCITDFVTMRTRKKKSLEQNVTSVRKIFDWNHLISLFSSFHRKFCDIYKNNFP